MPAGRTDAVGHRRHDQDQAERERRVAPPVDRRRLRRVQLAQAAVGPNGSEDPDRHRDQEHQPPVDRREHAAEHEADEEAADADDVVDAQSHPALVGGERVGDDRRRVRQQAGAADTLHEPQPDQVDRAVAAVHPVDGEQERRDRVDHEAEPVDLDPPDHVPQSPEADDEDARHDEIAEDHPQQIERVRGDERVEMDAAEDVGHRDDRDRPVQSSQQHRQGGVHQGNPLVAIRIHARIRPMTIHRLPEQFAC